MYRNRNLDIFIGGGIALLGGAAYLVHAPGPLQVVLGVALFFAPGYLWSEAILSQRLSGIERVVTSAGLALILPILGGFLFYGLRIPLLRSAWVGLLVVLTLLGVVAAAIVRLREQPSDPRLPDPRLPDPRLQAGRDQPPPRRKLTAVHIAVFGLAGLIGLGSVGFSVKNAEAEKVPGFSVLTMTPAETDPLINPKDPTPPATIPSTTATLQVINHQRVAEQYELKLTEKGKLTRWKFTLSDGGSWSRTIPYSTDQNKPILAYLYTLSDTSQPVLKTDNGEVPAPKATPTKKKK
ncbi:MAG TPA: DUF1616 domain-containing protein [Trebonia sp.]